MTDWICIRDDAAEARLVLEGLAKANGDTLDKEEHVLAGTPEQIADGLRPVLDVGISHILADLMRPYDAETIDRLPELREALAG